MRREPTIYIVDDDPSVARALSRVLQVAGFRQESFATAQDFLNQEGLESPACLLLDVQLPGLSGLELQAALKDRGWTVPIVFITGHGNVPMAVDAMRAGAVHFLPKPFDNRELLSAILSALQREHQTLTDLEERKRIEEQLGSLTQRERQVFDLVAGGMPNKNIAAQLGLSLQTVKLHRGNVMRKLGLQSVAELARLAEKAEGPTAASQTGESQSGEFQTGESSN
jgi:RNA polymerase sigma factor (sigma-70 family)